MNIEHASPSTHFNVIALRGMPQMVTTVGHGWFLNVKFKDFKEKFESVLNGFIKYHAFLIQQRASSREQNSSTEPVRSNNDNWDLETVEGAKKVKGCYHTVSETLETMPCYESLSLHHLDPSDSYERENGTTIWKHHSQSQSMSIVLTATMET